MDDITYRVSGAVDDSLREAIQEYQRRSELISTVLQYSPQLEKLFYDTRSGKVVTCVFRKQSGDIFFNLVSGFPTWYDNKDFIDLSKLIELSNTNLSESVIPSTWVPLAIHPWYKEHLLRDFKVMRTEIEPYKLKDIESVADYHKIYIEIPGRDVMEFDPNEPIPYNTLRNSNFYLYEPQSQYRKEFITHVSSSIGYLSAFVDEASAVKAGLSPTEELTGYLLGMNTEGRVVCVHPKYVSFMPSVGLRVVENAPSSYVPDISKLSHSSTLLRSGAFSSKVNKPI